VVVADHELDAREPSGPEALEETGPERPVLGVADGDSQHLAVPVGGDAGGDHHRSRHDTPVDASLDAGGVGEHVGELDVVQRPVPEGVEVPVELGADAGHLAAADPRRNTEGGDQVIHLPCGDAVDVGLHDHGEQGPVDAAPPFEQRREERPGPQLGDLQLEVPGGGGQQTLAVPVALGGAGIAPLVRAGADHRGRFGFDQLVENPLERRADRVGHLPRLERGEQLGQVRISEGHRRGLLRGPG